MIPASHVMVPLEDYPVVYEDETLKDAVVKLLKFREQARSEDIHHRSLLVFSRTKKVEGEERLVGILTVRDLLTTVQKNKFIYDNQELFTLGWAYFYKKDVVKESLVSTVGRAMRPLVEAYVQAGDPVSKVAELMITKKVSKVPVFDGKKAVGIIREIDILEYVGNML